MVDTVRKQGFDDQSLLPFPPSSSASCASSHEGDRWSGDSLGPRDGYSGLFASGMLRQPMICNSRLDSTQPSDMSSNAEDEEPAAVQSTPVKKQPVNASPPAKTSPFKTPARGRKRSSAVHATAVTPRHLKSGGADGGVDAALDNLMRSLKKVALGTPRFQATDEVPGSRWSSSSDDSVGASDARESEDAGSFWRSRKSSESVRSTKTSKSAASGRSKGSKHGHKVQETDRQGLEEAVPPVPATVPENLGPVTPSRRKRMMDGLAKKLGLTPRKNKQSIAPSETPDAKTGNFFDDLPLPPPIDRPIGRKSSLQTLRSIISRKPSTTELNIRKKGSVADLDLKAKSAPVDVGLKKKSSVTTLRSIMSAHPFSLSNPSLPDCSTPPVPVPLTVRHEWDRDLQAGCLPALTPRIRCTPSKNTIGQPRLHPSTSPNTFCRELPRAAPGTPKDEANLSLVEPVPTLPADLRAALGRSTRDEAGDVSTASIDSSMAFGVISRSPGDSSDHIGVNPGLATPAHAFGQPRTPLSGSPGHHEELFTPRPMPSTTKKVSRSALRPSLGPQSSLRPDLAYPPLPPPLSDPRHPPAPVSILRPKKSAMGAEAILGVLKARSAAGQDRSATYKRSGTPRGPLGLARGKENQHAAALKSSVGDLPFRSGAGDGWDTPRPDDQDEVKSRSKYKGDYFSHRPTISLDPSVSDAEQVAAPSAKFPLQVTGVRALDFTVSPSRSIRTTFGVDHPLPDHRCSVASTGSIRTGSGDAPTSAPSSTWEFERALEQLDAEHGARRGGMF